MPASAARDLSRRCRASGTLRIWIIAVMCKTLTHVHHMSMASSTADCVLLPPLSHNADHTRRDLSLDITHEPVIFARGFEAANFLPISHLAFPGTSISRL